MMKAEIKGKNVTIQRNLLRSEYIGGSGGGTCRAHDLPYAVADPGFPIGGRGPPTWALFGENVCENERIGSHRGACTRHAPPLDPPMLWDPILLFLHTFSPKSAHVGGPRPPIGNPGSATGIYPKTLDSKGMEATLDQC